MKQEQSTERLGRGKLRASYITSVVSITLVLYMLGFLGLIILHAHKLSEFVKENFTISVMLKDEIPDTEMLQLKSQLQKSGIVKNVLYVSRDEAAKQLSQQIGEDFMDFLGYNPLPASLDVQLKASSANLDSISHFEKKLMTNPIVSEVIYQKSMIDMVNQNIRRIGITLLFFGLVLLAISAALINNTIRLSIYARRFIIRSMLLIGATEAFIRKPFILKSMLLGLIAGIAASSLLVVTMIIVLRNLPELAQFGDNRLITGLLGLVILLGLLIAVVSTWLAVSKFLRMKLDGLYTN